MNETILEIEYENGKIEECRFPNPAQAARAGEYYAGLTEAYGVVRVTMSGLYGKREFIKDESKENLSV